MMDDKLEWDASQGVAFSSQTTLGLSSLVVRACIRESKKRKVSMCLDVPYYYCASRGAVLFAKFEIQCSGTWHRPRFEDPRKKCSP